MFFLIAEGSNKDILYGKFIYNRFLRIYPLVIVLFFLSIVVMRNHFTAIDYLNLFGLNLTGDGTISWIAGDWGYKDLSFNWWTIGVEFIFYLIFPFLFRFYKENGVSYLLKTLALIILLRYGLYYIRVAQDGWKTLAIEFNYSVFGHMDTFIVGMLTGFVYLRADKWLAFKRLISSKLVFCVSVVLAQLVLYYSDHIDNLVYPAVIGCLCGFLILSYVSAFKNVGGKTSAVLSYLGSISFSMYLLHSFVKDALDGLGVGTYVAAKINLLLHLTDIETSILMVVILYLPLVILLSLLTFSIIEKPFLQMRVSYLRKKDEQSDATVSVPHYETIPVPVAEHS